MAQLINVKLSRFDSQPWGFRLQGGKDFGMPLVIQKVNGGSLAEKAGLQAGDALIRVNDVELFNLRHKEAQDAIVRAGNSFELAVQRGGSTWKPTVTPVGPTPPVGAHPGPVTKTSLAARPAAPATRIGSAHNVSARPFAPQINGALGTDTVKSIVNKQYNSPVGMYSEETIAETLSAQAEVLAGGVLGVNFKKNEKNYNAEKSEVFKMVQEIDKEPREPEPVVPSGPSYFSRASHAVGGRATSPRPLTPLAQQLPPPGSVPSAPFGATSAMAPTATAGASEGVPTCGDCGRPIVGVFVRIKDKNLHAECFKCATCGTSLKNVGYYNINNKLYCDIHAKLVARQNPPAPNLEPVTIPPGSRIPSSTISSALASAAVRPSPLSAPAPVAPPVSRPVPSAAPLSPSSPQPGTLGPMPFHQVDQHSVADDKKVLENNLKNVTEAFPALSIDATDDKGIQRPTDSMKAPSSLAGPKPFGSVSSSTTARPAPDNSKFSWPPKQGDQYTSSVPTATPLYIPPPHLQNTPRPDKPDSKSTLPQLSQNNIPETIAQTPAVNVTYPEGTSAVASEQHSGAFPQPYSEFLQTQWNAVSSEDALNQETQSPSYEQYETTSQAPAMNVTCPEDISAVESEQQPETTTAFPQSYSDFLQTQWNAVSVDSIEQETQLPVYEQHESQVECDTVSEQKDEKYSAPQEKMESAPQDKVESAPSDMLESAPQNKESTFEYSSDSSQNISQEVSQEQQRIEHSDSTKHTQQKESISEVNNIGSTESPQLVLEATEQRSEESSAALTKTIRTVKVSEEFSHERKEIEILKATSGGIVTETVKTGATETNIKHESQQKSTELSQQGVQNLSGIIPPRETTQSTLKSKQISEYTESDNYTIKCEMQNSGEGHQDHVKGKEQTLNNITNQVDSQERISCQELQEMKDYFASDAGQMSKWATTASASACQEQLAERPRSPPPPPRSSPIDPQLKSLPHSKKRISMLEALTIAPEKPYSQLSVETTGNISSSALPGLANMLLNVEQSNSKMVKPQHPKAQVKRQQQETQKKIEYTAPTQQQHTQTSQEKEKRFSARTGLCPASVVPQYQQDLERFQIQRALSPAPHYRVPGSRSPSPAPVTDPEAVRHAYRFGAPLEPRGIHKSAKDLETVSALTVQQAPEHKQVPQQNIQQAVHTTAAQSSHFERNKQIKHTSLTQHPSKQTSQEKAKKQPVRASSGLRGASTLPYYQRDLERYQVQRALSPAPHFRVPGSRSPSPAPAIDPESFKHAYRFGGEVEPRGMHRSHAETETITATTTQQMSTEKQISQHTTHIKTSQLLQTDKKLPQLAQKNIPKLPQNQDKKTFNEKQLIQNRKQVSFSPHIKVATPFQQAGFQTQTSLPFPHIPLPGDQATMCPPQNVPVPNSPLSPEPHFQPPSALITNIPPISAPPLQDPKKPSCTAAPPAGVGGGVGGGKASGTVAGSTTPRRGRGILNQPGGRIPLCGSCNSQIRGPFITALGKIWCPEHFICVNGQCRRPLQDIGFVEEKGELYCEFCFEKYIAPTCDKCNTKIKGDCLNAIGKHFHPECFLCAYCGKLFGNSPFFLEDGLPYCEADWNELFTTKCFACGFPIEAGDRWVEALNNNYHSQCFNCTNCKKNLEGESFYAKGGRPFCKAHAR
ncbi:PDZ and LIM domain protein Zasp-like isoform X2 [Schistocerca serialis cubense]|uniref:PDZ and LIM domain protein Zasp-like isoform X2 n=1 Tax=Schistocerca serialis cubense TaxID=2023355 RepID=UPI00214EBB15|nr:PDZ and LIM domain protein Zasp-like isoform X2 [Schistocerca serialis cubense]